jgi:hypothetical protein
MHAGDERAITNIGQVNEKWAARQVSYLDRLIHEAGHQPGEWQLGRSCPGAGSAWVHARVVRRRLRLFCAFGGAGSFQARPWGRWLGAAKWSPEI